MGVFPHLWPTKIFFQKSGSVTFVSLWCTNFMQKIRKILPHVFNLVHMNLCDKVTNYSPFQRIEEWGLIWGLGAYLRGHLIEALHHMNIECHINIWIQRDLSKSSSHSLVSSIFTKAHLFSYPQTRKWHWLPFSFMKLSR